MKKIQLPDVTLLTATSVNVESALGALIVSSREIGFGDVKLMASSAPTEIPSNVEYVPIPAMDFLGYSRFLVKDLHRYFDTPYCLVVQPDGFVINANFWTDEFLEYDYIGAPWPDQVIVNPGRWHLKLDKNRVGNGGFSLRTHKLTELTSKIDFDNLNFPIRSEDMVICHYLYDEMVKNGIRYAPTELAGMFSVESPTAPDARDINSVFGFHGKHLMASVCNKLLKEGVHEARLCAPFVPAHVDVGVGRNAPCPCGSGAKYKHCHGKLT